MTTPTKREVAFHPRWGGYANLPPVPGSSRKYWPRVSTLAKALDDTWNLTQWQRRQVALGLKADPALLNLISDRQHPDSEAGKAALNTVADRAAELAGALKGADAGTEIHEMCERFDAGEHVAETSPERLAILRAYEAEMSRHGLQIVPALMERVVVNVALEVAGRFDRIITAPEIMAVSGSVPKIMDLKSQKWTPGQYDSIALAIQMASYATADFMLNEETWEWEPLPKGLSQTSGLIVWVPSTQPGHCEIFDVDLAFGHRAARAAKLVREWRNSKNVVTRL